MSDPTITQNTNFNYPLYSEDHPKFGTAAKQSASTLQKPEAAVTKRSAEDGSEDDWAANLSAAFKAKQGGKQESSLPQESKEFIARKILRQDSSATLVDFARRLTQANTSKFQLEVTASNEVSAPTRSTETHTFGDFQWRPSLSPVQSKLQAPHVRLNSDATLVDRGSWNRQGSRSGSLVQEMWRERLGSDATLAENRRASRVKLRQGSALGHWTPVLPDVPTPELETPTVDLEKALTEKLLDLDLQNKLAERDPLKGGLKQPTIEDDDDDDATPEAEVKVAPQEAAADILPTHFAPEPAIKNPFVDRAYPVIPEPADPARVLARKDLISQRAVFSGAILSVNAALLIVALIAPARTSGIWVLAFICFIKAKDCTASLIAMLHGAYMGIYHIFRPLPPVESKWILSLIPAYSESEEQIVKTVFSLRDNEVEPHKQVMAIVLDGKTRNVKQHMRITRSFRRQYVTSKFKRNELIINAGFMENVPVICFEKVKNAGKKDSLILCHDLFNEMRDNAPLYTKLLREDIWEDVLPELVGKDFPGFDMVFCTDADSTIHKGAVKDLADSLARDPKAVASCGLVLVELEPGAEWSFFNLYQQFQYCFGQFVRRQAESVWGKVTCLPGCITMIAVRPEMAGAIRKYAEPITAYPVLLHQVQYLGTDRRLTYSMLSQSTDLHTLFVPSAVSETVAPQNVKHYLSQRRRWGSNAYFNNYFYCFGEKMIFITRLWAGIELLRLSVVYYRVANTALFVYGLTRAFSIIKIAPLLVVSQFPTVWFLMNLLIHKPLRQRSHKILLGLGINKLMGPVMSIIIFTNVVRNLGSQAWGMTGGSNATAAPVATASAVSEKTALTALPLRSSASSIDEVAAAEATIGMSPEQLAQPTPEQSGEFASEVNEIDRVDQPDKISPVMDGL